MKFNERIYDLEFRLNDTDDLIIEYIQKHRDEIGSISIRMIADELFMSPNSIMRTCKKLGYSGFSELKFSIQNEDNPREMKSAGGIVLDKMPQNIIKTIDVLDEDVLRSIIDTMVSAKKILITGIGDSVYFCELLGRYLRCLDKRVDYFAQIHDMEYTAKFYGEEDLVFVISASGNVQRLVKLVENIKKRESKTPVYCITHYGENAQSKVCDKQLCFWGERKVIDGYNVTDRAGLAMLIRILCEEYYKRVR